MTSTNASSISRLLRQAGFNPLGSGTPRSREGIRVSGSVVGVTVAVDFDSVNDSEETAAEVERVLVGAGLDCERKGNLVFLTGSR